MDVKRFQEELGYYSSMLEEFKKQKETLMEEYQTEIFPKVKQILEFTKECKALGIELPNVYSVSAIIPGQKIMNSVKVLFSEGKRDPLMYFYNHGSKTIHAFDTAGSIINTTNGQVQLEDLKAFVCNFHEVEQEFLQTVNNVFGQIEENLEKASPETGEDMEAEDMELDDWD